MMVEKGKTEPTDGGRDGEPFRRETIHNQHRRSYWHDYNGVGLYMVTLVVEGRQRLFGTIAGTAKGRPGSEEAPHMVLSELGRLVLEEEVPRIHRFYPMVEVWRVAMMPDHVHLLLRVSAPLPAGKHLGLVVRGFKTGCSRAWWRWQDQRAGLGAVGDALGGKTPSTAASTAAVGASGGASTATVGASDGASLAAVGASGGAGVPVGFPTGNGLRPVLFEKGYHDRIINKPGMLDNIKRYMLENPLRARIRQECPQLMERQLHLWIGGREYAAFGNLFLLKYPIKEQVFFSPPRPAVRPAYGADRGLSERACPTVAHCRRGHRARHTRHLQGRAAGGERCS